jgi:hypothetical protein
MHEKMSGRQDYNLRHRRYSYDHQVALRSQRYDVHIALQKLRILCVRNQ